MGHVQKRLGSRLRSLKKRLGKNHLEDGKPIGGKGRLTDKVIDKLQVYYGKAIRQNTHSVDAMQNAIMAIWHIASLLRTIQTMISVLREKIRGVVSREMLQKEHPITSTKIPFQRQWLMPYYQPLKP